MKKKEQPYRVGQFDYIFNLMWRKLLKFSLQTWEKMPQISFCISWHQNKSKHFHCPEEDRIWSDLTSYAKSAHRIHVQHVEITHNWFRDLETTAVIPWCLTSQSRTLITKRWPCYPGVSLYILLCRQIWSWTLFLLLQNSEGPDTACPMGQQPTCWKKLTVCPEGLCLVKLCHSLWPIAVT